MNVGRGHEFDYEGTQRNVSFSIYVHFAQE